jgi:putative redox protein
VSDSNQRSVHISRVGERRFEAVNVRGGRLLLGEGQDEDFTPVELLLTAIAGCSAIDVDYLTSRRAQPSQFEISVVAEKLSDQGGNHLGEVEVSFRLVFPEGSAGDAAREVLSPALSRSHDRLCTVSRTVELPTPVRFEIG